MDNGPDVVGFDQEFPPPPGQRGLPVLSAGEFHGVAARKIKTIIADQGGCERATKHALTMLQDRGVLATEEVELLQSVFAPSGSGSADVSERVRTVHDQLALRRGTSPLALALASVAMNVDEQNFNNLFGAAVAGALTGAHVGEGFGRPVESAIVGAIVGPAVVTGIGTPQ